MDVWYGTHDVCIDSLVLGLLLPLSSAREFHCQRRRLRDDPFFINEDRLSPFQVSLCRLLLLLAQISLGDLCARVLLFENWIMDSGRFHLALQELGLDYVQFHCWGRQGLRRIWDYKMQVLS